MVEKCSTLSTSELYEISSNAFWLEATETLDLGCNDVAEVIRRLEERPKMRVVPSVLRNVIIMQLTDEWSVAVNRSRDVVVIDAKNYVLVADEYFLLLKCEQKCMPVEKAKKVRIACIGVKEYKPSDVRIIAKKALRNELSRTMLLSRRNGPP